MKIRKIFASAAAAASVSLFAISSLAAEVGEFRVAMADEDWAVYYWSDDDNAGIKSNSGVMVDGDGTYDVSIEFESPLGVGDVFFLDTKIRDDYPEMNVRIDSLKADGTVIEGNHDAPFIYDESGPGMRINIFSPWGAPEENYLSDLSWAEGVSKVEVAFTVTGLGPKDPTDPPLTGNPAVAAFAALAAVSGAAAIASKKRNQTKR